MHLMVACCLFMQKTFCLFVKRKSNQLNSDVSNTFPCIPANSEYFSDIIVGADGAYSAVRQNMYKDLKAKGKLSSSDDKPLSYNQHCLGK